MTRLFFVLVIAIAVVIILRALRQAARQAARPPGAGPRMTRAEALEVLGLKEGASKDEVRAAYKNLIRKVHPDAPGGSGYLASKLNQAKQVLLG